MKLIWWIIELNRSLEYRYIGPDASRLNGIS